MSAFYPGRAAGQRTTKGKLQQCATVLSRRDRLRKTLVRAG